MPVKTAEEHNNSYANSIELLYCKTESTNNGQNLDFHCLFELQYELQYGFIKNYEVQLWWNSFKCKINTFTEKHFKGNCVIITFNKSKQFEFVKGPNNDNANFLYIN